MLDYIDLVQRYFREHGVGAAACGGEGAHSVGAPSGKEAGAGCGVNVAPPEPRSEKPLGLADWEQQTRCQPAPEGDGSDDTSSARKEEWQ